LNSRTEICSNRKSRATAMAVKGSFPRLADLVQDLVLVGVELDDLRQEADLPIQSVTSTGVQTRSKNPGFPHRPPLPVEDQAARGADGAKAQPIVLRQALVPVVLRHLEPVEPPQEQGEHPEGDVEEDAGPPRDVRVLLPLPDPLVHSFTRRQRLARSRKMGTATREVQAIRTASCAPTGARRGAPRPGEGGGRWRPIPQGGATPRP